MICLPFVKSTGLACIENAIFRVGDDRIRSSNGSFLYCWKLPPRQRRFDPDCSRREKPTMIGDVESFNRSHPMPMSPTEKEWRGGLSVTPPPVRAFHLRWHCGVSSASSVRVQLIHDRVKRAPTAQKDVLPFSFCQGLYPLHSRVAWVILLRSKQPASRVQGLTWPMSTNKFWEGTVRYTFT